MSQAAILEDFSILTNNIVDVQSKPMLRSAISLALVELGHDVKEVKETLDGFYKRAVN